tara:strand:- start:2837 stop:2959 length:123 start_codon:yes stop_codon:yes gene_type:complete
MRIDHPLAAKEMSLEDFLAYPHLAQRTTPVDARTANEASF